MLRHGEGVDGQVGTAVSLLVQMAGRPGVGKSALARSLSSGLPATLLDNDVVKSSLLDSGVDQALAGPASWDLVFRLARESLDQDLHVILDNPSHYESIPIRGAALARETGATYLMVECTCDDEAEVRRRLQVRDRLPSHITLTQYEGRERWDVHGPADRIRADMLQSLDLVAEHTLEALRARCEASE